MTRRRSKCDVSYATPRPPIITRSLTRGLSRPLNSDGLSVVLTVPATSTLSSASPSPHTCLPTRTSSERESRPRVSRGSSWHFVASPLRLVWTCRVDVDSACKLLLTPPRETHFRIGELTYKLFDVGGQRSERRKWLNIFDSVTALVFLIAISECE